jgi:hypothetical protein
MIYDIYVQFIFYLIRFYVFCTLLNEIFVICPLLFTTFGRLNSFIDILEEVTCIKKRYISSL